MRLDELAQTFVIRLYTKQLLDEVEHDNTDTRV